MELIKNNYIYWESIRNLRNMDGVRQGFVQQNIISQEDHEEYMKKNSHFFWICVDKGEFLGYTGVIENDIRVATHPNYQGRGVGKFMINEIMKVSPNAFAKVKLENEPSLRLFESCGFKKKYYILEKE
jgi:ribosomal protein S18 acetylase RimI-like enzyme